MEWKAQFVKTMGSLSKHDVDGSENVIWKCNFSFYNHFSIIPTCYAWKCVPAILQLNWTQALGCKKTKLNICHHMLTGVHTTAKQVISRRRKNENVYKMSKNEKCTCKACKNTVFHCQIYKFVGFLLPSSSWLLKLPNKMSNYQSHVLLKL